MTAVLVVGAGPTGLMLAGELALAGVDVAIVERRTSQALDGSRAGGLQPRTIELLDQRGIAERFVAQGQKHPVALFSGTRLDIGDLPSRHSYWLGIWQAEIERTLADWVEELGVPILRGAEVSGFVQDEDGVEVALGDGRRLRTRYLVGCDGGRSLVRKGAGIGFPGWDASISYLIAEATPAEEPAWGLRYGENGQSALAPLDDGKRLRTILTERGVQHGTATPDDLRAALTHGYGTDYGVHDVTWLSRFTDATRQADSYRAGRVLLAGDAAHVHSPAGGQGLNIGVQDAVNLGWKLALVAKGAAPDSLLDSYHAERHPVGARALRLTMAMTALARGDDRTTALRETLSEVMQLDEPRRWYAARLSGLGIRYDLGEGHALLGRRMPDLDLVTDAGATRVFRLLHDGRPVLLNLGAVGRLDVAGWADRVRLVDAESSDAIWALPGAEPVAAPAAVLIRPDGYVAWVDDGSARGLAEALDRWFGAPTAG